MDVKFLVVFDIAARLDWRNCCRNTFDAASRAFVARDAIECYIIDYTILYYLLINMYL